MSTSELPPHLDPRGRHRGRHGSGLRGVLPMARVVGALLSAGLLVLAGYTYYTFRGIDNGVSRLGVTVGAQPTHATKNTNYNLKDQNILLVGNDDRTSMTDAEVKQLHTPRDGGSKATDTMMIVHIPADGSKATLISLPRDSYVTIAGHGQDRLNSAYVSGFNSAPSGSSEQQRRTAGANLLISTVTELTGLPINHYIQVSLLGFYEISNAIGGVPIVLCQAVDDTYAHNQAVGLSGGSGLKLSKGRHVIQGLQALQFVRQRHFLTGGDLDRVRRQQYFLTSAFRQVATVGILFKLNALGDAIKRNIYVDPTLKLIDLAHQLENLTANNIIGKTIPTTAATINGSEVLAVNQARVRAFVSKLVSKTPTAPASTTPRTSTSASRSATRSTAAPSATKSKAIDAKCIN